MHDKDIILKRHVNGLRLAATVGTGINFTGIFVAILTNAGWASELAAQLFTIFTLIGTAIYLLVAIFVNAKNYNYLLALLVFWFLVSPWLRRAIFGIDDGVVDYMNTYGGRGLDYQFIWVSYGMILAVLLSRFYLSLCLIFYLYFINAFYASFIIFNPKTFFTYDHATITTNLYAMHGGIFNQNAVITTFSAIALIAIAWSMQRNLKDATAHEKSNNLLGRYFSPEVRDEIEKNKDKHDIDEEKEQQIAVLFTDISNFTKLSEGMKPKDVLALLSEYQTKMVSAVFQHGGSVDKFIGDSVMATFGTPFSKGNDAQNALNCVRQMQIAMRDWEKERKEKNLPIVKHRIGVHFGVCFVGNVGSSERVEYTVIGDTVNVASRICDACKEIGAEVIFSDKIMGKLNEKLASEVVSKFSIRGRKEKIDLHKIAV
jgi:class 3 adenylate cyclase